MRPHVAILVIVVGGLIIAGIIFTKLRMVRAEQPAPPAVAIQHEASPVVEAVTPSKNLPPVPAPAPAVAEPASTNSPPDTSADVVAPDEATNNEAFASQAAVNLEVMRLMELSRSTDPQSITDLFAAATSPNEMIRGAALEGIKNKGDTNAIIQLKSLATKAVDAIQRKELLDAAQFLALPSLSNPVR